MKRILLCILIAGGTLGSAAAQTVSTVTQLEFFVDTDPGQGSGTPLLSDDGSLDEIFESASGTLNSGSLSLGYHTLFARVRNSDGTWGAAYQRPILVNSVGVLTVPTPAKLSQAEYFVDTDPGQGNGFSLAAADGGIDEYFEEVTATLGSGPYGLGMHAMFIRFRNSDGTWGGVYTKPFQIVASGATTVPIPAKLSHAEFFVDADPGPGNGLAMSSMDGGLDEYFEEASGSAASGSYSLGLHTLSVRFRNSDGSWGNVYVRPLNVTDSGANIVSVPPKITLAECFFDTDPGIGNGTAMSGTDGNLDELFEEASATLSTSSLGLGLHTLFVRFRNSDGTWGSVHQRTVEVTTSGAQFVHTGPRLTQAECFIDADPGPGNGIAVSGVDGSIDEYFDDLIAFIPTGSFSLGTHTLSLRLRTDEGTWGQVVTRTIQVTDAGAQLVPIGSRLSNAEYFINSDPGPGNGIPLTADDGSLDEWYENVSTTLNTSAMPEGVHSFGVRFRNDDGTWSTTFRSVFEIQNITPPVAPVNLAAIAGDSLVTLSWNANSETDILLYRVYGGTSPNPTVVIDSAVGGALDTTKIIRGLINGTAYYFRITAVDVAYLESLFSNEVSSTPSNLNPPAPPQNLVGLSGIGQVTLRWNQNHEGDFLRYRIYGGTTANPVSQIDSIAGIGDTVRVIAGLINGTTYYYRLTAVDAAFNQSAYSNEVSVTPGDVTPPDPPQNLVAVAEDSMVTLSWMPNTEADFLLYRIYGGTSANPTIAIDSTVSVSDTVSVVTGLANGTTYYFRIAAVDNALNQSAYSNEVTATPFNLNPPAIPQSLTSLAGDGEVLLRWRANQEGDFQRYRIYGGTTPNPSTMLDSTSGGILDTAKTVAGLQNGTIYYFRVTAVDMGYLESGFSNEVSATPGGDLPPSIPQNLSAVAADSQVTLTWDANVEPDFARYRIYGGLVSGPTTLMDSVEGVANVSRVLYGLANGLTYYFRITAVDQGGLESGYSNEVGATPVNVNPPAPPQLLAAVAGDGQITLTWRTNGEGDLLRYRIFAGTASSPIVAVDSSASDTTVVISGLTNFVTHYFRLKAVDNAYNESDFSNELSALPLGINQDPNSFSLKTPADQSLINNPTPTLQWEHRGDPDGQTLQFVVEVATDAAFAAVVRSDTVADSSWTVTPALSEGLYFWRVTAFDGFGGQESDGPRFFRLDATVPDLTAGVLQSPVVTHYLRVYVVSEELPASLNAQYVVRNSAGGNLDSAGLAMEPIRSGGRIQSDDLRLRQAGTLIVTVTASDSAGNSVTIQKIYAVVSLNKEQPLNYEDETIVLQASGNAAVQDGFIVIEKPSGGLPKSAMSSGDLPRFDLLVTPSLREKITLTVKYSENSVALLKSIYGDFDERRIGLYTGPGDQVGYLGGEGRNNKVQARIDKTGQISVRYNPEHEFLPTSLELSQNYPNPFNPSTTIRFGLAEEGRARLIVYNILGQKVKELMNEVKGPGYYDYRWDGTNGSGRRVATGVYFYRLETSGQVLTKKMLLVK